MRRSTLTGPGSAQSQVDTSGWLAASSGLECRLDLDDRDLAPLDGPGIELLDRACGRPRWSSRWRGADEWQSWRKASCREPGGSFQVASTQGLRGDPILRLECQEASQEVLAFFFRGDVDQRLGGPFRNPRRWLHRILAQNFLDAGHGIAVAFLLELVFDLSDELGDSVFVLFGFEMAERRQLCEANRVPGGKVVGAVLLLTVAGGPFLGPVEPGTLEGLAVDELTGGVDSGPLEGALGEPFFRAVAETVFEAIPFGLGTDDDGVVAAFPQCATPSSQPSYFFTEIGERHRLHPVQRQLRLTLVGASG